MCIRDRYLKPEQPPGNTLTRSPAVSTGTFSAAMNFCTSATAASERPRLKPVVACSVALMCPTPEGAGSMGTVRYRTAESQRSTVNGRLSTGDRWPTALQCLDDAVSDVPSHGTPSLVVPGRVDPVAEQYNHQIARRINPDGRSGETGMAEAVLARDPLAAAAESRGCIPPVSYT